MKVRAEIRLRHAEVIEARQRLGLTQVALAELAGVPLDTTRKVEMMHFRLERVRLAALKIADVLELPHDVVLPTDMEDDITSTFTITKEVETRALLDYSSRLQSRMILPAPDAEPIADELAGHLNAALATLTMREREVVKMRYGLDGYHTHTLREVGQRFKVTGGRVREIEAKALRKLQHPTRSKILEQV